MTLAGWEIEERMDEAFGQVSGIAKDHQLGTIERAVVLSGDNFYSRLTTLNRLL